MDYNVFIAFFLTLLAGLSTGIGSCIAFLCRHTNRKFLSVSLGFSAGVMIYVSMIEIFFKAQDALIAEMGTRLGSWATVAAFFGGMLIIAIIDKMIRRHPWVFGDMKLSSVEEGKELWRKIKEEEKAGKKK